MKRFLVGILALVLALVAGAGVAFADEKAVIAVSSDTVEPGGTVTLDVTATGAQGAVGYQIEVVLMDISGSLTLTSIDAGPLTTGGIFVGNADNGMAVAGNIDPITAESGVLFTVTLTASAAATADIATVFVSVEELYDDDLVDMAVTASAGEVTINGPAPDPRYGVEVPMGDVPDGPRQMCIDGVTTSFSLSDGVGRVSISGSGAKIITVYTYNKSSEDLHEMYPTHMYVWYLEFTGSGYTCTPVTALTDVLQYAGSSIRLTDPKGIRLITGVDAATKSALTGAGIAFGGHTWTLEEYGTVIGFDDQLTEDVLTTNTKFQNFAYKRGVADPVFASGNGVVKYTNVLVGFSTAQCSAELSMRAYMVLTDETGATVTIYGGAVHRSIGYIAYQNRNAFAAGTEAYAYIWDIIHAVYGSKYDGQ